MNRISKTEYYLDIAQAVLKRSTCLKRRYGCVIVKDDVIVATGYNGSPRGAINCCVRGTCKRANADRYSDYTLCDSVHAEQNALIMASREELKGATIYLACEDRRWSEVNQSYFDWKEDTNPIPCPICMRMIQNAGISKVINREGVIYDE